MVFETKFSVQNRAKIILNMIQGTKTVFYSRIQELVNPTKLNLVIGLPRYGCEVVVWVGGFKKKYLKFNFGHWVALFFVFEAVF